MSFILQEEIPDYTYPFINDLPIKGVVECYKHLDDTYETIPDNPVSSFLDKINQTL